MSLPEDSHTATPPVGEFFRSRIDETSGNPLSGVLVLDDDVTRVRQPRDLMGIGIALLGVVAIMALAAYAQATTIGVQEDVRAVSSLLAKVFIIPVVVLESLITLVIPVAVLTELAIRRMGRQVVEAAAALALGLTLTLLFTQGLNLWASDTLIHGLSNPTSTGWNLTIPGYVAGLCGLLTAAGPRTRRRTVASSWNLLWVSLAIVLVLGQVSLTGVFVALLLGRIAGLTVRYISGVSSERAQGQALVRGVRKAGFEPLSLIRVHSLADTDTRNKHAYGSEAAANGFPMTDESRSDAATHPFTIDTDTRVYAMTRLDGPRLDVVVLDGDRQIIGFIQRMWRSIRVRGIEGRSAISLRAVAERAALLNYAAQAAGVRSHKLLGVSQVEDSMLLVFEHPERTVPVNSLDEEQLTGPIMREAWRQIDIAHKAGLAHRAISSDVLLVSNPASLDPAYPAVSSPQVWITGWQNGDIASTAFGRHMDNAQMLTMFALVVGPDRAIAAAREVLSQDDLLAVGPLLQSVVFPSITRAQMREQKTLIADLRGALVRELPEADVEPQQIVRFGARTIVTWAITFVAVTVVFTTIKFDQITEAVSQANPWWAVATFALGLITWFGAAMTFIGFASVRLPVFRATLVQAAASFVALAAPAGIGPAALNLRMLTQRGVATSLAVATVALVQVSGFVVTILLVVILSVATGEGGALRALPSTTMIVSIVTVVLVGACIFLVPQLRKWVLKKIRPTFRQIWPRLSELLSTPWRLALGIAGNVIVTLGYIFAFNAALAAFGYPVSLIDVAIVFLVGNTVGSLAPTPGGIGAIEFALITGLTTTAGVPATIATSAVVLFRVATYWARIPLGWLAMRYLQKKNEL
ncbi:lysylphosphatidylglycerol synthase transmembrane domain-containing protein [Timonella sp. A28]|uniref:lysylphosphatidylglycerol synthase transmembrane domain-containing protein n=1 Tax=Timonella sp. A28 TaxID=3442640 RepID=UPI003EBE19A9